MTVPPPADNQWCIALRTAREAGKLIDVTLLVGSRKIQAHKVALVGLSPYLNGLLTSGLAESTETGHEMAVGDESTDGRAVEAIVDLMYSGKLSLSASTVSRVIYTANLLQVGAAEKVACDYFVKSLEPNTACEALAFAKLFVECGAHAVQLEERCVAYVVEHFAECSGDASFVELSREAVVELIGSDDLPVKEEVVVAAVRAWFDHDAAGRASALKSLAPLIRWPLLPVATQMDLWKEPLLHQFDKASFGLGLRLMSECRSAFAKSDAAAACPRLKRRKGSVLPALPLAFTAFRQEFYTVSEDGALVTTTAATGHRSALCRERVMNSGKSCAEFTVVQASNVMIGVAQPTLDANAANAYMTADFRGWENVGGKLWHNAGGRDWQGKQPFTTGDVLRLLLDSDAGTLTVKKNGTLLGVAVTQGLTGDLCWAVLSIAGANSVRIKAVDPAEF